MLQAIKNHDIDEVARLIPTTDKTDTKYIIAAASISTEITLFLIDSEFASDESMLNSDFNDVIYKKLLMRYEPSELNFSNQMKFKNVSNAVLILKTVPDMKIYPNYLYLNVFESNLPEIIISRLVLHNSFVFESFIKRNYSKYEWDYIVKYHNRPDLIKYMANLEVFVKYFHTYDIPEAIQNDLFKLGDNIIRFLMRETRLFYTMKLNPLLTEEYGVVSINSYSVKYSILSHNPNMDDIMYNGSHILYKNFSDYFSMRILKLMSKSAIYKHKLVTRFINNYDIIQELVTLHDFSNYPDNLLFSINPTYKRNNHVIKLLLPAMDFNGVNEKGETPYEKHKNRITDHDLILWLMYGPVTNPPSNQIEIVDSWNNNTHPRKKALNDQRYAMFKRLNKLNGLPVEVNLIIASFYV